MRPLLFISIYMNVLPFVSRNCLTQRYVDDIYSSSEMRDDRYYAMGALIIFLLLEPDKAKHTIFGTR